MAEIPSPKASTIMNPDNLRYLRRRKFDVAMIIVTIANIVEAFIRPPFINVLFSNYYDCTKNQALIKIANLATKVLVLPWVKEKSC